jgi:hypothetical protein
MAVENLVLPVFFYTCRIFVVVTQPYCIHKIPSLPKFPRQYALTCSKRLCHIGMRMSVFLEIAVNLPSIAETLMMCFCLCCLSSSLPKGGYKTKGATEFTNCTSIISVVSICPNFSRQLFVFRKSTC